MGIEPPFGALNKYFSGDGIPQDPEDDDWKQRPRYACPRKAVAVCFFFGGFNRRQHVKKAGLINGEFMFIMVGQC